MEENETAFLGGDRVVDVRESLRRVELCLRIERGSSMEERRKAGARGRGAGLNSREAIVDRAQGGRW